MMLTIWWARNKKSMELLVFTMLRIQRVLKIFRCAAIPNDRLTRATTPII